MNLLLSVICEFVIHSCPTSTAEWLNHHRGEDMNIMGENDILPFCVDVIIYSCPNLRVSLANLC